MKFLHVNTLYLQIALVASDICKSIFLSCLKHFQNPEALGEPWLEIPWYSVEVEMSNLFSPLLVSFLSIFCSKGCTSCIP